MVDQTPAITPADVYRLRADGWMLLDVRTDDEWAQGRIDGSVHIPMDQVVARLDEVGEHVVCVCAVGARSERVAQYLNQHGFEAVNLTGGVYGWVDAGKPVVS
ncbi:MAG TPA: rhodanese-like domain-containing protein [Microlunatus sp.]|nr:rhodanese-like domain-containing protein [Microlunatus sp.]